MDKLLKLYDELENTYCPYKHETNINIDWCEVCKNNDCTNGYYEICHRISKRIEDTKKRIFGRI